MLHWLIALLILANLALGVVMTQLDLPLRTRFALVQWHKTLGVLVLLASLARLGWRLAVPPPPAPPELGAGVRRAARLGHALLYALMILVPLAGWALVSAATLRVPTRLPFGLVWPDLPVLADLAEPRREEIEPVLAATHALLAAALATLALGHIAAALWHQARGEQVMARMLPWAPRASTGPAA